MTVHLPAVANDRQLSGQALLAVDAGKLLRSGYRVAIHGHNDVAHLQPQLTRDTTGWCSFDQNPAAPVGTQPTGNFCGLALIHRRGVYELARGTHCPVGESCRSRCLGCGGGRWTHERPWRRGPRPSAGNRGGGVCRAIRRPVASQPPGKHTRGCHQQRTHDPTAERALLRL
jgi:hypothetical protein